MRNIKNIFIPFVVLLMMIIASGYTKKKSDFKKNANTFLLENEQNQIVNLFVTHGHCSTPFSGVVDNLKVVAPLREDLGNPLENMSVLFEIDPNTFNVCAGEELTAKIKTPGLFIGADDEKITFRSTNVYTMGIDWYQINGKLSIKGIEKEVTFFGTGIRTPNESMSRSLVLQGQMNLLEWGIDYGKIVNGKSNSVPTKWMYINMKIDLS
ncbi:YceI family protein [Tenacibaculum ovolyticum]|uniref:YceI family protein n=1 Tax=Tenacibaculum ovolyticum TaxID=104270 RepID=UPI0022F3B2F3|nr:YceI family protein [Tenacibaculum ovolyticum]WBX77400.1 YceI family protein [Tenacibaculum ovolyticum]